MASPVQPVMKTVTESWMFTHRSWIGGALLGPATVAAVFRCLCQHPDLGDLVCRGRKGSGIANLRPLFGHSESSVPG